MFILLNKDYCLCSRCYKKLKPHFQRFYIGSTECFSIYDYDENFESLLYQFKGCSDIELAPIFLERYKRELCFLFRGYQIIPIPSHYQDDLNRGFNHVLEIAKSLSLPVTKILIKTEQIKQANQSKKNRGEIAKFLNLAILDSLNNKKVLILDDVYTTGSTIYRALELVKSLHPKEVKVLVISKTPYKKKANTK